MTVQISLAAARVNKGYSQPEAAELIGVTAKTLRSYEKGITAIPAHTFRRLANLYEVPEEFIVITEKKDKL